MSRLEELLQVLTDKENQPHQYVGKPVELEQAISDALTEQFNIVLDLFKKLSDGD
jgi:hypothetical protein